MPGIAYDFKCGVKKVQGKQRMLPSIENSPELCYNFVRIEQ